MINISRRNFLQKSVLGAGSALAITNTWGNSVVNRQFSNTVVDVIIELTARPKTLSVQNNKMTKFWCYEGKLLKGTKDNLIMTSGSYLGPKIQVNQGDKVRIIFKNELGEKSIIHWHGLDVDHDNDGHPSSAIETGETYQYDFEVVNRAGMYWYHPHPHGKTGSQVYKGLSGLFIVRDKEEKSLRLPENEKEMQFVIQDRSFKKNGDLLYRNTMMGGAYGNTLMINGMKLSDTIKVSKGSYRLRMLNGCNARVFNMSLSNGTEFQQIGSDGGLLRESKSLKNFYFGPAERFDCLVDFSNFKTGEIVTLEGLPLVPGRGKNIEIMRFEITEERSSVFTMANTLSDYDEIDLSEAVNLNSPKVFKLFPKSGMTWTINGLTYEANRYVKDELINFGDTEVWEFYNPTGIPHPMHIHGTQFQVIKRESGRLKGCLDEGFKDVTLVMPGDRVQVIKRFNTFKGSFVYHCHNLEHEDMSMMRNFKVI